MSNSIFKPNPKLDLVMERIVDVPPQTVWKAWTTPDLLKQWFAPKPWKTIECKIDLRPGGLFHTTMQSPEGQNFPGDGCYLEVVENKRLVFTDALKPGFRPSEKPFFTAAILLEPHGPNGTKYTALGIHRDEAARKQHEDMGFEHGWATCLEQLVATMKSVK